MPPRKPRGAVLLLALTVLATLSIAALAGAQTSALELRMARNAHDGALALAAAQAALAEGEQLVMTLPTAAFGDPNQPGLHLPAPFGAPTRWRAAGVWAGPTGRTVPLPGVAAPPRFIIEWVTTRADGTEAFRVTARGVGGTLAARAMVQSVVSWDGANLQRLSWRELEAVP